MDRLLIASILVLCSSPAFAQPPDTLWTSTIGGDHTDLALSVLQAPDGGFVFAGSADAGTHQDAWLARTDAGGTLVWSRTYGGTGEDGFNSLDATSDGGFVMGGYTSSSGAGSYDSWLVKVDSNGNYQWDSTFGDAGQDLGYEAIQLSDGGYAIVGYVSGGGTGDYDIHLVRTDSLGSMTWERFYGVDQDDEGYSVCETADGGFAVTGYTASTGPGPYNLWLLKTDGSGMLEWSKVLGGAQGEIGRCVRQTSDGGYIVSGITSTYGSGLGDLWLVKTDASGNVLWDVPFGGSQWDDGHSVSETADGGFVVTGYSDTDGPSEGTGYDLWVIRTDGTGAMEWELLMDTGFDCWGQSVALTTDGGYIVAGYSWNESSGPDDFDAWLIRLDHEAGTGGGTSPSGGPCISAVYPNPSNGSFSMEYVCGAAGGSTAGIYSLDGKLVAVPVPVPVPSGRCTLTWSGRDASGESVPSGVYVLRASDGSGTASAKLIVVR